jgi:hypothetical protein
MLNIFFIIRSAICISLYAIGIFIDVCSLISRLGFAGKSSPLPFVALLFYAMAGCTEITLHWSIYLAAILLHIFCHVILPAIQSSKPSP